MIGREQVDNLHYDTTIIAGTEQEIATLLSRIEKKIKGFGLTISRERPKLIIINNINIQLERTGEHEDLETVDTVIS